MHACHALLAEQVSYSQVKEEHGSTVDSLRRFVLSLSG
jgi:hypothetical protein